VRLPRLTSRELAEMLVIGFFCASLVLYPLPLQATLGLVLEHAVAAQVVAIALSLLIAVYLVSSAKTIWLAYRRA